MKAWGIVTAVPNFTPAITGCFLILVDFGFTRNFIRGSGLPVDNIWASSLSGFALTMWMDFLTSAGLIVYSSQMAFIASVRAPSAALFIALAVALFAAPGIWSRESLALRNCSSLRDMLRDII
jgi:hypothetical protein